MKPTYLYSFTPIVSDSPYKVTSSTVESILPCSYAKRFRLCTIRLRLRKYLHSHSTKKCLARRRVVVSRVFVMDFRLAFPLFLSEESDSPLFSWFPQDSHECFSDIHATTTTTTTCRARVHFKATSRTSTMHHIQHTFIKRYFQW